MPITVKHGGETIDALVALAALAGAGQQRVPEVPRVQPSGTPSGGGGGGGIRHERVPWYRRLWGGPKTRRARVTPEEQLQYEAEKMELQAKAEAEGWERRYSAKARQDIAMIEKARQDLKANPAFSEEEKIRADRTLIARSLGIDKDVIPPDPNKEVFEPGKGPRDIWRHPETGDLIGYDRNGSPVVRIKFADTPEGRAEKHQQAMELEQAKAVTAYEKEMRATRTKLSLELVDKLDPTGIPTGEKRHRTGAEVEEAMFRIYGPQQRGEAAMVPPAEQGWEQAAPRELISWARNVAEYKKEDEDLPGYVKTAQAFMRGIQKRIENGEEISPRMNEAIEQAKLILAQYKKQLGGA